MIARGLVRCKSEFPTRPQDTPVPEDHQCAAAQRARNTNDAVIVGHVLCCRLTSGTGRPRDREANIRECQSAVVVRR